MSTHKAPATFIAIRIGHLEGVHAINGHTGDRATDLVGLGQGHVNVVREDGGGASCARRVAARKVYVPLRAIGEHAGDRLPDAR